MYCNSNFNRTQWAIFGQKRSGKPGDPYYRGTSLSTQNFDRKPRDEDTSGFTSV